MFILRLPRLGQTMELGTIVRWMVEPGVPFDLGEEIYEVSTEKVDVAVEAKVAGTVLRILANAGEEIEVGAPLAVVGVSGDTPDSAAIDQLVAHAASHSGEAAEAPAAEEPVAGEPVAEVPAAESSPASARGAARSRVIPRARALAAQLGIDLSTIEGSGSGGAITVADVEQAARRSEQLVPDEPASEPLLVDAPAELLRQRLSGVHRAMAESVARSRAEIPQFTQTVLVDCSMLLRRRSGDARAAGAERPLSINDYLVHAVVTACDHVPDANARIDGEDVVTFAHVNPSVAIAAPTGLLTPVLRRADQMDLRQLSSAMRELVGRAREGALTLDDFFGGTIMVSNLGMFGVDFGSPMVQTGQAVTVFAGALKERPLAVAGRLVVRPTLYVSISADHRVLDGATGALFLTAIRDELERGS